MYIAFDNSGNDRLQLGIWNHPKKSTDIYCEKLYDGGGKEDEMLIIRYLWKIQYAKPIINRKSRALR